MPSQQWDKRALSRYESAADLYDKVSWEGGLLEAIFEYGIHAEDLPTGTPDDIVLLWEKLAALECDVRYVEGWLEDNADEGRDYD